MTTAGLRLILALAALAGAVALAGCAIPAAAPKTHPPTADSAPGSGAPVASDEALPPDQDGHPACAAYDSWRPGPGGAGITVTYWFEGAEPATVAVRQPANPDLTQTVGNDASQRHHDFAFIDADPPPSPKCSSPPATPCVTCGPDHRPERTNPTAMSSPVGPIALS